ncbi:hypothetical protein B0H15DRAFT_949165 [Mycena belliarum]|uniref:Uncharacterized protein n=1 Tax=Mycena belliarum TaxID=1033014 RepID=A0AAD6U4K3_9AGAR|nr:hypothetical protein B0H15DRAFT_949165 [Mycena belliae]
MASTRSAHKRKASSPLSEDSDTDVWFFFRQCPNVERLIKFFDGDSIRTANMASALGVFKTFITTVQSYRDWAGDFFDKDVENFVYTNTLALRNFRDRANNSSTSLDFDAPYKALSALSQSSRPKGTQRLQSDFAFPPVPIVRNVAPRTASPATRVPSSTSARRSQVEINMDDDSLSRDYPDSPREPPPPPRSSRPTPRAKVPSAATKSQLPQLPPLDDPRAPPASPMVKTEVSRRSTQATPSRSATRPNKSKAREAPTESEEEDDRKATSSPSKIPFVVGTGLVDSAVATERALKPPFPCTRCHILGCSCRFRGPQQACAPCDKASAPCSYEETDELDLILGTGWSGDLSDHSPQALALGTSLSHLVQARRNLDIHQTLALRAFTSFNQASLDLADVFWHVRDTVTPAMLQTFFEDPKAVETIEIFLQRIGITRDFLSEHLRELEEVRPFDVPPEVVPAHANPVRPIPAPVRGLWMDDPSLRVDPGRSQVFSTPPPSDWSSGVPSRFPESFSRSLPKDPQRRQVFLEPPQHPDLRPSPTPGPSSRARTFLRNPPQPSSPVVAAPQRPLVPAASSTPSQEFDQGGNFTPGGPYAWYGHPYFPQHPGYGPPPPGYGFPPPGYGSSLSSALTFPPPGLVPAAFPTPAAFSEASAYQVPSSSPQTPVALTQSSTEPPAVNESLNQENTVVDEHLGEGEGL